MSETPEQSKKEAVSSPETEEELSPQKAWTLLFNSFKFSQGSGGLQELIFYWIHARYPNLRMGDNVYQGLLQMKSRIREVINKPGIHKYRPPGEIDDTWRIELDNARDILNGVRPVPECYKDDKQEMLLDDLTRSIVERDGEYLVVRRGRPREKSQEGEISPDKDPFLSQLCYYGFEGKAPTEEYREFWKKVVDHIKNKSKSGQLPPEIGRDIRSIVKVYEEKHPGKKIDLSFLEET